MIRVEAAKKSYGRIIWIWSRIVGELAGELVKTVISLPIRLFICDARPNIRSAHSIINQQARVSSPL